MSLSDDYRDIHATVVLGSIAPRRQIAVAGSDRAAYLHGLLTNDILSLGPGQGCYAAWLTPQGRMLTDMEVLESGDLILLDVPEATADSTLARLDEFLFSEDVRLESLAGRLTSVWVHGPQAALTLGAAVKGSDMTTWGDHQLGKATFEDQGIVVARLDQLLVPGYCVYVDPSYRSALEGALVLAGARMVGAEALEAARIEAGHPLFGIDMTEDTIPLEAGIEDRAISFSKGCYVGQEVIIRVLHRGHGRVAKKLAGLGIEGPPPAHGDRVLSGDREIGYVTSAACSPSRGTIALAYVHRDFLEPGTKVQVRSGGALLAATVQGRRAAATS
jgi:folate-binding protein YgfZ